MRTLALLALSAAALAVGPVTATAAPARTCGSFATASAFADFSTCPPERISGTIQVSSTDGSSWSGPVAFTLREKDPVSGVPDSRPTYTLTEAQLAWQVSSSSGECSSSGSGTLGLEQLDGQLQLSQDPLPSGFTAPPGSPPYRYDGGISLKASSPNLPRYTVTCPPPPDGRGTFTEPVSSRNSLGTAILYIALVQDRPVQNILTDLNTFTGTIAQGSTYVATWNWALTGGVTVAKQVSGRGVAFIKREEGFRAKSYNDELGYCTIGYGTLYLPKRSCTAADKRKRLTKDQAEARLRDDLDAKFEPQVRRLKVQLTQCQYDALASFVYNVSAKSWGQLTKGLTTAKLAGLSRRLLAFNQGRDTKTGKYRVVKAVDQRRKREAAMFDRCPCDEALPKLKPPYYAASGG